MPNSHHRHKAKHHHQPAHPEQKKKKFTAAIFMMVMFGIFGISIAYFTSGGDLVRSILGAVAGILVGYLFGNGMDKSAREKV